MTPEQKRHWRYTFAGQIAHACVTVTGMADTDVCIKAADALIAALEASAPKEKKAAHPETCNHDPSVSDPRSDEAWKGND